MKNSRKGYNGQWRGKNDPYGWNPNSAVSMYSIHNPWVSLTVGILFNLFIYLIVIPITVWMLVISTSNSENIAPGIILLITTLLLFIPAGIWSIFYSIKRLRSIYQE